MSGAASAKPLCFDFGSNSGGVAVDHIPVTPKTFYQSADGAGFGLAAGVAVSMEGGSMTSKSPFLFSAQVPDGNYAVTVTFGNDRSASTNTVKAELRRLMLEQVHTRKGELVTRTFIVNVRTPSIRGAKRVRLKERELQSEMINWDDRLTLEFNGSHPSVRSIQIAATNVPTLFIAGDSTVCDQPLEPWNSWGQMLPRFFGPGLAVANYAQSGESIRSSLSAGRFEKIFTEMKTNDWLLVQFGHNDMKDRATNALAVYTANLKQLVAETRAHGATPVLITSMERKAGLEHDTLAGYPDAVREVAEADKVALIDLHRLSRIFYRALGSNLDKAFQDGTHHNNYGSYELARCVVEALRANQLELARYLASDAALFNPAQPDRPEQFSIPASGAMSSLKPDGN